MAITKSKSIRGGAWRTIESGWNAQFWISFFGPKNVQIKVRYGGGFPVGWDSQKQTLDEEVIKWLKVTRSSIIYARVQVYSPRDTDITYTYYPAPFDGIGTNPM